MCTIGGGCSYASWEFITVCAGTASIPVFPAGSVANICACGAGHVVLNNYGFYHTIRGGIMNMYQWGKKILIVYLMGGVVATVVVVLSGINKE